MGGHFEDGSLGKGLVQYVFACEVFTCNQLINQ